MQKLQNFNSWKLFYCKCDINYGLSTQDIQALMDVECERIFSKQ